MNTILWIVVLAYIVLWGIYIRQTIIIRRTNKKIREINERIEQQRREFIKDLVKKNNTCAN